VRPSRFGTSVLTASLLATSLLAALAIGPAAAAKDAPGDLAGHPLVGAWLIDATPHDTADPLELLSFDEAGIVTNPGAAGLGSWASTGKRGADATIMLPSLDPAGGFVGFVTIRANVAVAADGRSFAGTYTLQLAPAVEAALGLPAGQLGPGAVTAQRIVVEPMSEPVAPIPNLGQPPVGASACDAHAPPVPAAGRAQRSTAGWRPIWPPIPGTA
jgi:hypothetical protein